MARYSRQVRGTKQSMLWFSTFPLEAVDETALVLLAAWLHLPASKPHLLQEGTTT